MANCLGLGFSEEKKRNMELEGKKMANSYMQSIARNVEDGGHTWLNYSVFCKSIAICDVSNEHAQFCTLG